MRIAKPAHIRLTARRHRAQRVPRDVQYRSHYPASGDEEEQRRGLDKQRDISASTDVVYEQTQSGRLVEKR